MPVTITRDEAEPKVRKFERIASTIAFPYSDIDDAIAVADGLLKGGGIALSRDQLAAAMEQSPTGGGFNTKVSTARSFGVIESIAGKYQLTELGFEIADPARQREAMTRAFLNVELYKRAYDEFRGKRLPPRPHGLENAFMSFGVSQKQAATARLYFDRSARKAGFFPNGDEDRLVMPFNFPGVYTHELINAGAEKFQEADHGVKILTAAMTNVAEMGVAPGIHKTILGMLDELPPPKANWSKADQADWLDAIATLFQVIYKSEDKGSIEVRLSPDISSF